MATTSIEWTATVNPDGSVTPGRVWNPVTGCHKVSPGCKHCYAEGIAKRLWKTQYPPVLVSPLPDQLRAGIEAVVGQGQADDYEAAAGHRPREFGDVQAHSDRLIEPFSWKKPCKVFVNSMSDLFEEAVPIEFIDQVFAVMALCPHITFIVLTKRPERMREYVRGAQVRIGEAVIDRGANPLIVDDDQWPLRNVWLLVSVENQKYADERVQILLETPAAVRGISYEPGLDLVDLNRILRFPGTEMTLEFVDALTGHYWTDLGPGRRDGSWRYGAGAPPLPKLDWVIVGGESGPGARPFDVAWTRAVVQQCAAAGVACFVKQLGAQPTEDDRDLSRWPADTRFREDDSTGGRYVVALQDRKGGDVSKWPKDLQVRQFPEARA